MFSRCLSECSRDHVLRCTENSFAKHPSPPHSPLGPPAPRPAGVRHPSLRFRRGVWCAAVGEAHSQRQGQLLSPPDPSALGSRPSPSQGTPRPGARPPGVRAWCLRPSGCPGPMRRPVTSSLTPHARQPRGTGQEREAANTPPFRERRPERHPGGQGRPTARHSFLQGCHLGRSPPGKPTVVGSAPSGHFPGALG